MAERAAVLRGLPRSGGREVLRGRVPLLRDRLRQGRGLRHAGPAGYGAEREPDSQGHDRLRLGVRARHLPCQDARLCIEGIVVRTHGRVPRGGGPPDARRIPGVVDPDDGRPDRGVWELLRPFPHEPGDGIRGRSVVHPHASLVRAGPSDVHLQAVRIRHGMVQARLEGTCTEREPHHGGDQEGYAAVHRAHRLRQGDTGRDHEGADLPADAPVRAPRGHRRGSAGHGEEGAVQPLPGVRRMACPDLRLPSRRGGGGDGAGDPRRHGS